MNTLFLRWLIFLSAFLFAHQNTIAQMPVGIWKDLSDIKYEEQYSEIMGFDVEVPVFGEKPKLLEGQEITIKGYIIPLEGFGSHKEFIFSAFPYNMCYFCGGAGPETVMEVFGKDPVDYTAQAITIKGNLVLNRDDINRLMYFLLDAQLVK